MKNNLFKHVLWFSGFLILIGFTWFLFIQIANLKLAEFKYKQDYSEWQMNNYDREIIKFCQQLSATTTNTGWKYTNCLKQLGITAEPVFQD